MSRSATPATRNEATTRLKPPKMTTSAELTIGTAIRSSHERLRTVADADATSSEHTLNPQTPRVKREPLLRIREKWGKGRKGMPSYTSKHPSATALESAASFVECSDAFMAVLKVTTSADDPRNDRHFVWLPNPKLLGFL